jgi:SAM-dependent methyltransferase
MPDYCSKTLIEIEKQGSDAWKMKSRSGCDYLSKFYPETRFGGFTFIDSTVALLLHVRALMRPDSIVLDIGAGRGKWADDPVAVRRELRVFKGRCARVIGIDVDAEAAHNPFLDEFRLIEGDRWPIEDDAIDLSVCDNVLEHVPDPDAFFGELRRVTRPGGYVCLRTPNVASYFGLASRLIPDRLHSTALNRVQRTAVDEKDVFPTVYRCNTRRKLRRMLTKYGFENYVCGYEAEPSYLSFSRVAYAFGVLHQKLAPSIIKVVLLGFGRKSAELS